MWHHVLLLRQFPLGSAPSLDVKSNLHRLWTLAESSIVWWHQHCLKPFPTHEQWKCFHCFLVPEKPEKITSSVIWHTFGIHSRSSIVEPKDMPPIFIHSVYVKEHQEGSVWFESWKRRSELDRRGSRCSGPDTGAGTNQGINASEHTIHIQVVAAKVRKWGQRKESHGQDGEEATGVGTSASMASPLPDVSPVPLQQWCDLWEQCWKPILPQWRIPHFLLLHSCTNRCWL